MKTSFVKTPENEKKMKKNENEFCRKSQKMKKNEKAAFASFARTQKMKKK